MNFMGRDEVHCCQVACLHPIWTLLFYDSQFWEIVGKRCFMMLRAVCREFRTDLPEQFAIRAVFKGSLCRKVDLFRMLPLSVNDVVRMRSPVSFVAAFDIAVRRWGGFESCMAFVREWGWINWNAADLKRRAAKEKVDTLIRDAGFDCVVDEENQMYQSVVTGRKRVDRVVVWRYTCTFEGLLPRAQFNPYEWANGVSISRRLFANLEFNTLLRLLKDAVGFWYKGVHGDARAAEKFIRQVRHEGQAKLALQMKNEDIDGFYTLQHQLISGRVLLLGVITVGVWE